MKRNNFKPKIINAWLKDHQSEGYAELTVRQITNIGYKKKEKMTLDDLANWRDNKCYAEDFDKLIEAESQSESSETESTPESSAKKNNFK